MKVGDLFKIIKGKKVKEVYFEKKDGLVRYIQIDDLRSDDQIKYTNNDPNYVFCSEDDLVIAWDGANAGTIGFGLSGVIGSTLAVLKKKDSSIKFDTGYVGRFMKTKSAYLREKCTGATIPHIQKGILENIEIPLPPLHIQKQIAQVLDEADALIQKRKLAIAKLDELVQSVFLEMFGDPVSNPKAWKLEKLKKLGTLGRGVSKHRPRNDPKLLGGKYPLVQTGDVARSGIYLYEYNQTYSELGLRQSKMWPKGTLCITIAANIADASILTFDACFPDSVVGFIPERELTNCEYIYCWISHLKRYIEEKAPQVAQKNINLTILSDLDVPVPPINLQNQFAMIVSQIESQKHHMQKQLAKLEENFNALLQRAFKGELQFRQAGEWDAPQRGFSEAVSAVEVHS